jgi:hypothetical protein
VRAIGARLDALQASPDEDISIDTIEPMRVSKKMAAGHTPTRLLALLCAHAGQPDGFQQRIGEVRYTRACAVSSRAHACGTRAVVLCAVVAGRAVQATLGGASRRVVRRSHQRVRPRHARAGLVVVVAHNSSAIECCVFVARVRVRWRAQVFHQPHLTLTLVKEAKLADTLFGLLRKLTRRATLSSTPQNENRILARIVQVSDVRVMCKVTLFAQDLNRVLRVPGVIEYMVESRHDLCTDVVDTLEVLCERTYGTVRHTTQHVEMVDRSWLDPFQRAYVYCAVDVCQRVCVR